MPAAWSNTVRKTVPRTEAIASGVRTRKLSSILFAGVTVDCKRAGIGVDQSDETAGKRQAGKRGDAHGAVGKNRQNRTVRQGEARKGARPCGQGRTLRQAHADLGNAGLGGDGDVERSTKGRELGALRLQFQPFLGDGKDGTGAKVEGFGDAIARLEIAPGPRRNQVAAGKIVEVVPRLHRIGRITGHYRFWKHCRNEHETKEPVPGTARRAHGRAPCGPCGSRRDAQG